MQEPPKSRPGEFFMLDREQWGVVADTGDLNLMTAWLVLSAGCNARTRLSKWSGKASEKYAGMARRYFVAALDTLSSLKLAKHTEKSTRTKPQYALAPMGDGEPIFVPNAFVTALGTEHSLLYRLRQTRNPLALRLCIDLYGFVEADRTYSVSASVLWGDSPVEEVCQVGANRVWAITPDGPEREWTIPGAWPKAYRDGGTKERPVEPMWESLRLLIDMGVVRWQPWLYSGDRKTGDPFLPVFDWSSWDCPEGLAWEQGYQAGLNLLTVYEPSGGLARQREHELLMPLPAHFAEPSIVHRLRMRVEADTRMRRDAYGVRIGEAARLAQELAGLSVGGRSAVRRVVRA